MAEIIFLRKVLINSDRNNHQGIILISQYDNLIIADEYVDLNK